MSQTSDLPKLCALILLMVMGLRFPTRAQKMEEHLEEGKIKLFLGGDVMPGRGIDQALPHSVSPVLYESYVRDAEWLKKVLVREGRKFGTSVRIEKDHSLWLEWKEHKKSNKKTRLRAGLVIL